jgi:hypothetical protein
MQARRANNVDFLRVLLTVIVCLAPIIACYTSLTHGVRFSAGSVSGGALGRTLSVKQEKRNALYILLWFKTHVYIGLELKVRYQNLEYIKQ